HKCPLRTLAWEGRGGVTRLAISGAHEHVSRKPIRARLACPRKVHHPDARQAAALFLIAPMIAVSMAPPAPPAITCEMMPSTLRLPDCAAAVMAGSNSVTTWPSTPPPIKPEIMLPIIPRSKVGDDFPTATPPSAPCNEVDQNLFHVGSPSLSTSLKTIP